MGDWLGRRWDAAARSAGATGSRLYSILRFTAYWGYAAFGVAIAIGAVAMALIGALSLAPEGAGLNWRGLVATIDAINTAITSTDAWTARFVLLIFIGAVSIPLLLFRAHVAERQAAASTRQAEEQARSTEEAAKAAQASQEAAAAATQASRDAAANADRTSRFLKAVELLGALTMRPEIREGVAVSDPHPNIEIRLGAIYTLEALAKEPDASGALSNHWPIMEIMLAYIRTRRGPPVDLISDEERERWDLPEDAPAAKRIRRAKAKGRLIRRRLPQHARRHPIAEDVAAAIAVLQRRDAAQRAHEFGGAAPEPVDWESFHDQHPEPSDDAPTAKRVAYAQAKQKAVHDWRKTAPTPTRQQALGATSLTGADIRHIDWRRQDLSEARMEGADLIGARMEGADLFGARMEGADLSEARMEGACLVGVALGPNKKSSPGAASLSPNSAAPGDDFYAKGLTQEAISRSFGDARTAATLPEGLVAPDHWAKEELNLVETLDAWRAWRKDQGYD